MSVAYAGADQDRQQPIAIYRAGLGRRLPKGAVRMGPLITIPDVLKSFGVEADGILESVGVPPDIFADPDNTLPYPVACRLIFLATQATGRDDVGLLMCEHVGASGLGLVGFLLKQAPDVCTALNDLVRYLHHHDRGAVPFLTLVDGEARLGSSILEPHVPATEQVYDCALAIGLNIMRGFCGAHWAPTEVTLSRHRPVNPARYERFFGSPVRFDAEQSALVFPQRWLDLRIENADPALRRVLQEQIDLLETEERSSGLAEQVRRLLRTCLLTSNGSFDDVASLLQITKRTLTRRLEVEGTTFRHLSEEIQYEIARQLIENTSMTMTEIGLVLRYSEASAFSRAFRQWAGTTPRAWRARHLADSRQRSG
jgi:AraC-like DNA-binding protein